MYNALSGEENAKRLQQKVIDDRLAAARVAGTVGDVLGGLHEECVAAGRLAGRVETLLWAQSELQVQLAAASLDRFADTRALEEFLVRVQDSLRNVQDGSGAWDGLVRSVVEDSEMERAAGEGVPAPDMGG